MEHTLKDVKLIGIGISIFACIYFFLFIYYKSQTLVEMTGGISALIESMLPIP